MSQNSEDGGDSKKARLEAFLIKSAMGSEMKETVRALVLLSAQHGFVTVQNLAECIPDSETDPYLIEEIMNILDALDIKLLDEDEIEVYRKKVEESESKSAKQPRSYDSLDRYDTFFTKLGYKPPLKQAEVNDLVKRMEESEQAALDSLHDCGLALPFQVELALKLIRREEPLAKLVDTRKIESLEAYYRILPKTLEECTKLKVRLDMAWQKYLKEADPDKKSLARDAYRKIELNRQDGCKEVLRKFCFKMKLILEWLDGTEIKSDIEDSVQIAAAFSASSVQSSPGPAGWQALYVNRARDIERRWRLSPSDLAHLNQNFRRHLTEADKVREEMFRHNSRLVTLIAEFYQHRGAALAELIDVGNASLRSRIDDFNPRKGYSFTHYAAMGVRHALLCLIAEKAGIKELPVRTLEFIEVIPEVHAQLRGELGRDPSLEEMANELNIAIDDIPKLLCVPGLAVLPFSMSKERGSDGREARDRSRIVSPDPGANPMQAQVMQILEALEPKEKDVIILRFGLLDGVMHSQRDVALYLKVSTEEIEAIEASALGKIRVMTQALRAR